MKILRLSAASFAFSLFLGGFSLAQTSALLMEARFNTVDNLELKNGANVGSDASGPSAKPGDLCYFGDLSANDPDSQQAGPAAVYQAEKELEKAQELTVTLWYKCRQEDKGGMLLQGYGWNIALEKDHIHVWLYDTKEVNSNFNSKATEPWPSTEWTFLVLTWTNADRLVTFLRGGATRAVGLDSEVHMREFPDGISQQAATNVGIGNNAINYKSGFDGSIDNVRVFNRLLTNDEMETIRQADLKNEALK